MRADLAQHNSWTGVVAQRHRTGREIFVEASIRVLSNAYNLPKVFVTSSCDVTARIQAEAALRTTQAHERLLFVRNLAGICRATLDGQILACNQSYAQMLGYESPDELLDLPASALYVEQADRASLSGTPARAGHLDELRDMSPAQGWAADLGAGKCQPCG